MSRVEAPDRAEARAASEPAWPPPITTQSNWEVEAILYGTMFRKMELTWRDVVVGEVITEELENAARSRRVAGFARMTKDVEAEDSVYISRIWRTHIQAKREKNVKILNKANIATLLAPWSQTHSK